jgi:hypothetical protein
VFPLFQHLDDRPFLFHKECKDAVHPNANVDTGQLEPTKLCGFFQSNILGILWQVLQFTETHCEAQCICRSFLRQTIPSLGFFSHFESGL